MMNEDEEHSPLKFKSVRQLNPTYFGPDDEEEDEHAVMPMTQLPPPGASNDSDAGPGKGSAYLPGFAPLHLPNGSRPSLIDGLEIKNALRSFNPHLPDEDDLQMITPTHRITALRAGSGLPDTARSKSYEDIFKATEESADNLANSTMPVPVHLGAVGRNPSYTDGIEGSLVSAPVMMGEVGRNASYFAGFQSAASTPVSRAHLGKNLSDPADNVLTTEEMLDAVDLTELALQFQHTAAAVPVEINHEVPEAIVDIFEAWLAENGESPPNDITLPTDGGVTATSHARRGGQDIYCDGIDPLTTDGSDATATNRARRGLPEWDANDEYMPVDGSDAAIAKTNAARARRGLPEWDANDEYMPVDGSDVAIAKTNAARARRGLPEWDANDEYMPVDGADAAKTEHRARRGMPEWDANDEYMPVDGSDAEKAAYRARRGMPEWDANDAYMPVDGSDAAIAKTNAARARRGLPEWDANDEYLATDGSNATYPSRAKRGVPEWDDNDEYLATDGAPADDRARRGLLSAGKDDASPSSARLARLRARINTQGVESDKFRTWLAKRCGGEADEADGGNDGPEEYLALDGAATDLAQARRGHQDIYSEDEDEEYMVTDGSSKARARRGLPTFMDDDDEYVDVNGIAGARAKRGIPDMAGGNVSGPSKRPGANTRLEKLRNRISKLDQAPASHMLGPAHTAARNTNIGPGENAVFREWLMDSIAVAKREVNMSALQVRSKPTMNTVAAHQTFGTLAEDDLIQFESWLAARGDNTVSTLDGGGDDYDEEYMLTDNDPDSYVPTARIGHNTKQQEAHEAEDDDEYLGVDGVASKSPNTVRRAQLRNRIKSNTNGNAESDLFQTWLAERATQGGHIQDELEDEYLETDAGPGLHRAVRANRDAGIDDMDEYLVTNGAAGGQTARRGVPDMCGEDMDEYLETNGAGRESVGTTDRHSQISDIYGEDMDEYLETNGTAQEGAAAANRHSQISDIYGEEEDANSQIELIGEEEYLATGAAPEDAMPAPAVTKSPKVQRRGPPAAGKSRLAQLRNRISRQEKATSQMMEDKAFMVAEGERPASGEHDEIEARPLPPVVSRTSSFAPLPGRSSSTMLLVPAAPLQSPASILEDAEYALTADFVERAKKRQSRRRGLPNTAEEAAVYTAEDNEEDRLDQICIAKWEALKKKKKDTEDKAAKEAAATAAAAVAATAQLSETVVVASTVVVPDEPQPSAATTADDAEYTLIGDFVERSKKRQSRRRGMPNNDREAAVYRAEDDEDTRLEKIAIAKWEALKQKKKDAADKAAKEAAAAQALLASSMGSIDEDSDSEYLLTADNTPGGAPLERNPTVFPEAMEYMLTSDFIKRAKKRQSKRRGLPNTEEEAVVYAEEDSMDDRLDRLAIEKYERWKAEKAIKAAEKAATQAKANRVGAFTLLRTEVVPTVVNFIPDQPEVRSKLVALFCNADPSKTFHPDSVVGSDTLVHAAMAQNLDKFGLKIIMMNAGLTGMFFDRIDSNLNGIAQVNEILVAMDDDGNGNLSLDEFLHGCLPTMAKVSWNDSAGVEGADVVGGDDDAADNDMLPATPASSDLLDDLDMFFEAAGGE
jgi:hypothetical protein